MPQKKKMKRKYSIIINIVVTGIIRKILMFIENKTNFQKFIFFFG